MPPTSPASLTPETWGEPRIAGQSSATPTGGRELLPALGSAAHPRGHLSGAPGRKEARHSGRGGASRASHASSRPAPAAWAALGSARTSAPSRLIHSHHIHEVTGAGPGSPAAPRPPVWDPAPAEAQAPVGRPRLPLWGGSFHLVTTQKCVAAAPPCPRVCLWGLLPAREGAEARGRTAPLPWERSVEMRGTRC